MGNKSDVIVVGAGLAGLTAAQKLIEAGQTVTILEARDRVGGRTYSKEGPDETWLDLGAQWVGNTHTETIKLAEKYGVRMHKTYDEGKNIFHWSGKQHGYSGFIPRINPFALLDFAKAQAKMDMLARKVDFEKPWLSRELDDQTFETWIKKNTWFKTSAHLLRLYTNAVFATEPKNISLLHALFYTHSSGGSDWLAKVSGGAQEIRFIGGTQAISNAIALELGDIIKLSSPVDCVRSTDSNVMVMAGGAYYYAKHIIMAMPPTLLNKIEFTPQLSPKRTQLLQRVPPGSVIKAQAVYETPFWRDQGLSGQVASNVGPIKVVFDNSNEAGTTGVLTGFWEGEEAVLYSGLTQGERMEAFTNSMVTYFGEEARNIIHYEDMEWATETYSGGCYAAHFAPGVWTQFGDTLRVAEGRIHWAGTETAIAFNGYMEGAIRSAARAVGEILGI